MELAFKYPNIADRLGFGHHVRWEPLAMPDKSPLRSLERFAVSDTGTGYKGRVTSIGDDAAIWANTSIGTTKWYCLHENYQYT